MQRLLKPGLRPTVLWIANSRESHFSLRFPPSLFGFGVETSFKSICVKNNTLVLVRLFLPVYLYADKFYESVEKE